MHACDSVGDKSLSGAIKGQKLWVSDSLKPSMKDARRYADDILESLAGKRDITSDRFDRSAQRLNDYKVVIFQPKLEFDFGPPTDSVDP